MEFARTLFLGLEFPIGVVMQFCKLSKVEALFCYPQDSEILGWCPAESVLPHGEKVHL